MTRKKKIIIGAVIVVVLGALAYANLNLRRPSGVEVNVEKIEKRDLESIVSASGKIEPKRSVNISAETMGKVVGLDVREGDYVKQGQLLLQIDAKNLETNVQNREASLASAKLQLDQTRAQIVNARVAVKEAEETLKRQEQLYKSGLLPRDQYERIVNDVTRQKTNLLVSEQSASTQEERIKQEQANLESARYDLNKLRVVSPISGIVTRRNIEVGETAVVGTMNNAGTVLLTIADLSVIETELEVDETDIPFISIGQPAKVTIDALPDQTFSGRVTEVGNSPIQVTAGQQRATNFKVVVTIDGEVPNVRPGFACTAVITTATRKGVVSVPIQSMTLREVIVDEKGQIVPTPTPTPGRGAVTGRATGPAELKPGEQRKEQEGVFLAKGGRATFTAVKTGIAGEKYFEVLTGLNVGDEVITGPFASVRSLRDGDEIRVTAAAPLPATPGGGSR
jgi:HlyD family secretion protein